MNFPRSTLANHWIKMRIFSRPHPNWSCDHLCWFSLFHAETCIYSLFFLMSSNLPLSRPSSLTFWLFFSTLILDIVTCFLIFTNLVDWRCALVYSRELSTCHVIYSTFTEFTSFVWCVKSDTRCNNNKLIWFSRKRLFTLISACKFSFVDDRLSSSPFHNLH